MCLLSCLVFFADWKAIFNIFNDAKLCICLSLQIFFQTYFYIFSHSSLFVRPFSAPCSFFSPSHHSFFIVVIPCKTTKRLIKCLESIGWWFTNCGHFTRFFSDWRIHLFCVQYKWWWLNPYHREIKFSLKAHRCSGIDCLFMFDPYQFFISHFGASNQIWNSAARPTQNEYKWHRCAFDDRQWTQNAVS